MERTYSANVKRVGALFIVCLIMLIAGFPAEAGVPLLVQSNAGQGAGIGSLSVPFSSSNTAGNLIVVFVRMSTTSQTVVVADTAGNKYATAVSEVQTSDGHQIYIFYASNVRGGMNTVTSTFSATNNHPWTAIYEFSGLSKTSPLDQVIHAQGTNANPLAGSITNTGLIFAGIGLPATAFSGTVTAGPGFTILQQDTGRERAANEAVTASGSYQAGFTLSAAANWSAAAAVFRTDSGVIPPLTVTTTSLPNATQGVPYTAILSASGGVAPYTWSITSGRMPPGLTLQPGSGTISGNPTGTGNDVFTAQATDANSQTAVKQLTISVISPSAVNHYLYAFLTSKMYVYDIDHNFQLVKQVPIPFVNPVRGVAFAPPTHTLYVSYGGDGGSIGPGSMVAYDVLTDNVLWNRHYSDGVDSMAITPDGKTIYMPSGESNLTSTWYVIDASTGNITGTIQGGMSPHNTVMSLDGSKVYLLPRNSNFVRVVSTATNTVIRTIGPMLSGVRPSTINGRQTLIFTTATGFLGFQVSDIITGKVLYTVPVAGFSVQPNSPITAPSHGVSLSPDEKELWLMDAHNSYVHVFDVSGLPAAAPRQIADIALSRPMTGPVVPCTYDCYRDGWVMHSRDGRYVVVGNSGDVLDTATHRLVVNLDPLYNTKVYLEIDWQNGAPVSTTTRHGLGYVTN